jgi:PPM family protein phosphatase
MSLKLDIGNKSDVGKVREVNEDYFGSFSGNFGNLLIVCDGMGGHKGGETASRIAVETIRNHFENLGDDFDIRGEIGKALQSANDSIIQTAESDLELSNMGSTVILVLIKDGMVHYASLGDSRIYLVREDRIKQLTKDHSLVQKMVDSNLITEEEARDHPKKNVITKALGTDKIAEPEFYEPFKLLDNDKLILCSDGLTTHVDEKEILEIIRDNMAQDSANKLVELANKNGGIDNITVQVMSAQTVPINSKTSNDKITKYLLYAVLTIALAVLIYLLFAFEIIKFSGKERKPVTINKPSGTAEIGNNNKRKQVSNIDSSDISNQSIVNQDSLINNIEEANNEEDSSQ